MNMNRQANQYSNYLCGIYTVLSTISHVEMVQVMWQDVEKTNAIAMTFCRKKKKTWRSSTDFVIPEVF